MLVTNRCTPFPLANAALPWYISPGHYVYNGMIAGLYRENNEAVLADPNSEFFDFLECPDADEACMGTAYDYITWFFGGIYGQEKPTVDILVLAGFLILGRVGTWIALKYIRHA